MITLDTDILQINRIGTATAKRLKLLGIESARDLLLYFPFRYDDYSHVTPIAELKEGMTANIVGQIELIQNKRSPRRRMFITEALVNDGTESAKVVWFNQPYIGKTLKVGDTVSLAGKVEEDFGGPGLVSPTYEKISLRTPLDKGGGAVHTQGLVPNYHLTANITQKQLRFLIKSVIHLAETLDDWMPMEIKNDLKLLNLGEAIRKIHFPAKEEDVSEAKKRLGFEELLLIQLQSQLIREDIKASRAEAVPFREEATKKFVESLPFQLTDAQRKAAWEILKDIGQDKPMSRLLEGDVGSGKTVVAVITMFNVALDKKQAVLMVPTEILAKQHFDSISKLLDGWDMKVGLVTRSNQSITNYEPCLPAGRLRITNKKNKAAEIIQNADIIIGTHALIQEDIRFRDLALVIIDEQHRFGVEQRKMLIDKSNLNVMPAEAGTQKKSVNPNKKNLPDPRMREDDGGGGEHDEIKTPHLLSMTATPIPRSLALALYGDLDLSIINEMPKDRKKIITNIVPEEKRDKAYGFIREQIKEGRQVFVICPLIDISDKLGVKSVKEEFEKLDKIIFPDLAIGILHGKLKPAEKEKTMQAFLENKINILVSTSVVEVGVDVPNATIMMIEGADRFGLASLHQFRGRVGRGPHQSYCFLFTDSDAPQTLERLDTLTKFSDGLSLAKADLQFRGPGEVYGTMQKGFPELKMASLFDYELMKDAKDQAEKLLAKDNDLSAHPALKERVGEWERKVHLE